ncbi:hypothetical protein BRADI_3g59215v3 [Brachypodium distachyon]|uniref:Uncharacterized protein n=1 Tax=Brachypodium distachyon TaxID=15368 RepID=A0A2K2D5S5_BRADI|nr:hypothetical protein BRADI_3g59215v3 [Brachypodium distachyon]
MLTNQTHLCLLPSTSFCDSRAGFSFPYAFRILTKGAVWGLFQGGPRSVRWLDHSHVYFKEGVPLICIAIVTSSDWETIPVNNQLCICGSLLCSPEANVQTRLSSHVRSICFYFAFTDGPISRDFV